ncbi:hypothetical protein BH09GEM1_BH09GEM1_01900 [soil metagenome]
MSIVRLSVVGDCLIRVDDVSIDPSSTHLFALLLVLALDNGRRIPRSELQRLLFAEDVLTPRASHNLRQLLYRIRRLGVSLEETGTGLRLAIGSVSPLEEQLRSGDLGACEDLTAASVAFLPSYCPRLPQPFLEWLDRKRDYAENVIRTTLCAVMARQLELHAWKAAHRVGSVLKSLDPFSADAIEVMAEALTMMGRRAEALSLLASFDCGEPAGVPAYHSLRPLRARIARLPDIKADNILRGRHECLSHLEMEWTKLGGDGARRVALVGNAGIGKTRVAEAFAARVRLLGAHVSRYTCDVSSSEQPLGLFSDLLPEFRAMRGSIGASPEHTAALDRLRPASGISAIPAHSDMSVEAVRAQLQHALIDLLEAVSDEKPLLLIIDDAHFLDSVSTNIVRTLCTRENSARLLILLCVRRSHVASPVLEPVKRGVLHILDPLPLDSSRQIVLDIAGAECPASHVDWCVSQAAGNPFYLRTLASQRFVDASVVPFDIRALASNAYSSLSSNARSVLETCLLLGRLASLERVCRICAVEGSDLIAALRELETLELIQFSDGMLSGPHALLHEALSALVPTSVMGLLHRRIAALLESECASVDDDFALAWAAARNWLAAGDRQSAAELVTRCAKRVARLGEPGAAVALLTEVMDTSLPAQLHVTLIEELMRYAEAAGSQAVVVFPHECRQVVYAAFVIACSDASCCSYSTGL